MGGDELSALVSLQNDYPYSQPVHNLATRAATDNDSSLKGNLLHLSAIYTTDRTVLKSLMDAPKGVKAAEVLTSLQPTEATRAVTELATEKRSSANIDFLIDNVFVDLENLRKSKLIYEASMELLEEKENRVIEHLKSNDPELQILNTIQEEVLVEKLESDKKETITTADKQKEQIEIIENFIKTQPGLQKPKLDNELPNSDLSDKSQHFADNVISETLVEILLKQGKKAKAVEVLKKLIWKFPQKKAYFAAQIEDLKK